NVSIASTFHYIDYEAYHSTKDTCAIVISYTGENDGMLKCIDMLRERGSSIISLTSIGDNTISKLSDVTLHITTRETHYSKIGNSSIHRYQIKLVVRQSLNY